MTFTYDLTAPVGDVSRVRFHLRDTDATTAIFTDEEIEFAISEYGDYKSAIIVLIRGIIAMLANEPDMTADWLKIDWRRSVQSWQLLLKDKEAEFGLGIRASGGGQHVWRPDTRLKRPPDYGD